MDTNTFTKVSEIEWRIEPSGAMRVPAIIYGQEQLIRAMDEKVREQIVNVATLPGIVRAAYAMPDAHWGYGFPIGGVAAFDPELGGVISAGGVGFDISCGVRTHLTGLRRSDIKHFQKELADALFKHIPVGLGSQGDISLGKNQMDAMLAGGAAWALKEGYGESRDLEFIEDQGCAENAVPEQVSFRARERQQREMGTLGSGNHYLEIQEVAELFDPDTARVFGLVEGECVVTIHCGSRGLGHQIGTEFLREMAVTAADYGISLPDRELACAPIQSETGKRYIGAMRSAINCALANRQIIGHLTREVFRRFWPDLNMPLLFDVSHNTCKPEFHKIDGQRKTVYVHRKGATRAFGPGHATLPEIFKSTGQPVLIGGSLLMAASLIVLARSSTYRPALLGVLLLSAGWSALINVVNPLSPIAFGGTPAYAVNLACFYFGIGAFVTPLAAAFMLRRVGLSAGLHVLAARHGDHPGVHELRTASC